MRILLTNDDGVHARGLEVLERLARTLSDDITIVAPLEEQSGKGRSLSLTEPVRLRKFGERRFAVTGTPTDAVMMALAEIMKDEKPDLILSGVNRGANLGEDVSYSGTVSAAMEGRFLGLPAVAVSLATRNHEARHYATAARAAVEIVARLKADPLPADTILNVNVPDLAWSDVRGFEVTRLGNRHRSEPCVPQPDPRGSTVYWIGPAGREQDAGPGTDFHAVRTGHISITPIHVDLTRYQALEKVASWVGGLTAALEDSA